MKKVLLGLLVLLNVAPSHANVQKETFTNPLWTDGSTSFYYSAGSDKNKVCTILTAKESSQVELFATKAVSTRHLGTAVVKVKSNGHIKVLELPFTDYHRVITSITCNY